MNAKAHKTNILLAYATSILEGTGLAAGVGTLAVCLAMFVGSFLEYYWSDYTQRKTGLVSWTVDFLFPMLIVFGVCAVAGTITFKVLEYRLSKEEDSSEVNDSFREVTEAASDPQLTLARTIGTDASKAYVLESGTGLIAGMIEASDKYLKDNDKKPVPYIVYVLIAVLFIVLSVGLVGFVAYDGISAKHEVVQTEKDAAARLSEALQIEEFDFSATSIIGEKSDADVVYYEYPDGDVGRWIKVAIDREGNLRAASISLSSKTYDEELFVATLNEILSGIDEGIGLPSDLELPLELPQELQDIKLNEDEEIEKYVELGDTTIQFELERTSYEYDLTVRF